QDDIHQRLGSVTSEAYLQGQSQTDTLSGERDLLQEDMLKSAGSQGLNYVHQRPAMFSTARTDADLRRVPGHGSSFAVREGWLNSPSASTWKHETIPDRKSTRLNSSHV